MKYNKNIIKSVEMLQRFIIKENEDENNNKIHIKKY